MSRIKVFAILLLSIVMIPSASRGQTTRPVAEIRHALIISVDGLRPDLLLRVNTPTMHELFSSGAYTFWAKTTEMSITLPSHTSMLTGVVPDKHGIKFNDDGPREQVYPNVPTIFQFAKKAGYTTALAASKSKFATLAKDVDWVSIPPRGKTCEDEVTAKAAADFLKERHPDLLFVHFAAVDVSGHADRWGSEKQARQIERVDACVKTVLDGVRDQNLLASTAIILTADHGGTGLWHGPDDARARHIPWIISGPGIRKGFDLTTIRKLNVNTEDTFATTCWLLAIPMEGAIDGKPVKLVLENPGQLIEDLPGN